MDEGVLGVVIAGGTPLDGIGTEPDAAWTPFAGRYRFIDFALATLRNSGVPLTLVLAPARSRALAAHLAGVTGNRPRHRPRLEVLSPATGTGRAARLAAALVACRALAETHRAATLVVLVADHVLQLDLRPLIAAQRRLGADVVLAALPVLAAEAAQRTVLDVDAGGQVRDVRERSPRPLDAPGPFALSWGGDLVVRAAALADAPPARGDQGVKPMQALIEAGRVAAYDVLDVPGETASPAPYWHDPTTVEEHYEAEMALCAGRSGLDLHDPDWPVLALRSGLPAARLIADEAGRPGQALNASLADGVVVRGAVVANAVVGPRATIASGAEVEDSILLEGCRIGRHARVRRAVVGAGAVVEDGAEIGYGSPCAGTQLRASGLTVVPAAGPEPLATAASAR